MCGDNRKLNTAAKRSEALAGLDAEVEDTIKQWAAIVQTPASVKRRRL